MEYLEAHHNQIYPYEEDEEILALHRINLLKLKLVFFLSLVQ